MSSNSSTDELMANVRQTTATALDVLRHMESAIHRSGFSAGVGAYEQLAATLGGQRAWTLDKPDGEVDRQFAELAQCSARIRSMLIPYVRIMEQLTALGAVRDAFPSPPVACAPSTLAEDERPVFEVLRSEERAMTLSSLREETKLGSRQLRSLLARLEEKGLVRREGSIERPRFAAVST